MELRPEGDEGDPAGLGEDIGAAGLIEPVRSIEDEVWAPPRDRVGGVNHVEHPAALPELVHGLSWRARVKGEADRPPFPEARVDLGAPRVTVLQEGVEVLVEVRGAGEDRAAEPVRHVELATEGSLTTVGPEALSEGVLTAARDWARCVRFRVWC